MKSVLLSYYKPSYRCFIYESEESPDSTEQYTGEEPGPAKAGTDSATENNRLAAGGIRVKKWGKSPQWLLATAATGKPCML